MSPEVKPLAEGVGHRRVACGSGMVPHVVLSGPEFRGQEDGLAVERGKARVGEELWCDLDGPVVWIDRDEPSVE